MTRTSSANLLRLRGKATKQFVLRPGQLDFGSVPLGQVRLAGLQAACLSCLSFVGSQALLIIKTKGCMTSVRHQLGCNGLCNKQAVLHLTAFCCLLTTFTIISVCCDAGGASDSQTDQRIP